MDKNNIDVDLTKVFNTARKTAAVGDTTSKALGTGARFNNGKPDYSLMILKDMRIPKHSDKLLTGTFESLGNYQLSGELVHIENALDLMYDYACETYTTRFVLDAVVRVWEYGKDKYTSYDDDGNVIVSGRNNWVKGMPWSVPLGCAVRHLLEMVELGEDIEKESGQPHWASVICNLQMLRQYQRSYPEGNDFPYLVYEKENLVPYLSDGKTEFEYEDLRIYKK